MSGNTQNKASIFIKKLNCRTKTLSRFKNIRNGLEICQR